MIRFFTGPFSARPLLARPLLLGLLFVLAGCGSSGDTVYGPPSGAEGPAAPQGNDSVAGEVGYYPVAFDDLPGWGQDNKILDALMAFRRSCAALTAQVASKPMGPARLNLRYADWRPACGELLGKKMGPEAAKEFFENYFQPFRVQGPSPSGLFTGYYEVELAAARKPDQTYRYPIYRRPGDLRDGTPYFDRAAIERGAIKGRKLELYWARDPVALFFLHVQGSGRLRLPDGSMRRVGFAGNNGHGFVALGKIMQERGLLKRGEVTAQGIMAWLRKHPQQAPALMAENPRYIFFKDVMGDGPVGAQGVPLTPGRSLAVDPKFIPLGAPVWLDTTWPAGVSEAGRKLQRLMIGQDTGSAIKGAVRGDVFWGTGDQALRLAGGMKQNGIYYLLLPKTPLPVAAR